VAYEPAGSAPEWGVRSTSIGVIIRHDEMLFCGLEFAVMRDIGAGAATTRSRRGSANGMKK
jgi:hypothetical protein